MGTKGQTVTCPTNILSLLIAEESTVRIHIKRCVSFMFLTAKKIPSVSHHTKSNKICNELQQKNPMQFGYRTKSNTERFCEFDARTKHNRADMIQSFSFSALATEK